MSTKFAAKFRTRTAKLVERLNDDRGDVSLTQVLVTIGLLALAAIVIAALTTKGTTLTGQL